MNSLSVHLAAGSDHSSLRFHPDCPVCRQQGPDALSNPLLLGPARAGLLAAALGAGTLIPSSLAAAPHAAEPPTTKASQAPASAPTAAPTPLPEQPLLGTDETQEAPVDEAPHVRELLTSPEAGTDTGGEDVSGEGEETAPAPAPLGQSPAEPIPVEQTPAPLGQPPAPPAPVEPPPASSQPAPTPMPQPYAAPVETPPAAVLEQVATPHPTGGRVERKPPKRRFKARRPAARGQSQSRNLSQSETAPQPMHAVSRPTTTRTALTSQPPEPPDGRITGGSYTVRPGDSLWTIARRLVGPKASSDQIAREVNRLWDLNRDRIGTGDASLVYAGTVLRLP